MRSLGIDPITDTQATFRALVEAMSRPGTIHPVPTSPADHAVISTLVDHEVSCHTDDVRTREALADAGRLTTAEIGSAAIVHSVGPLSVPHTQLAQGTDIEPSMGATVIYRIDALAHDPPDGGVSLTLRGPGVDGARQLGVMGLPVSEFSAIAGVQAGYPRGIDVVLCAPGAVAALPRSVTMEVS